MNMLSPNPRRLFLAALVAFPIVMSISGFATDAHGQRITYKEVEIKRTIDEPVTKTRWVEKKSYESETKYKQVIQTEKRQRVIITKKPIVETKYRTETIKRQKPVSVEKFRERRTKQTTFKTISGFRDETETVREPVIETEMRTEKVTVQKPVTKELIEVQKTTTLKPVVTKETEYDIQGGQTLYQVLPDVGRRSRIRLLSPGYYTDPTTGLTDYRRGGLHWVKPNATVPVGQTPPTISPREVDRVTYEPEVVETRRPISVTSMVEETIEREVPYEVKKFVERTVTRKVPYEYKMPVDKIVVEKIPYTETTYEEELIERKVPYTETRMQEVRTIEDYEVEVPRYVSETVQKEKPVRRWVEEEVQTTVQRVVYETMKVPCNPAGEPLSDPVPLDAYEYQFVSELPSTGVSTTRKPTVQRQQEVYETQGKVADEPIQRPLRRKPTSIIFPETKRAPQKLGRIPESLPASEEITSEKAEATSTTSSKATTETSSLVRSLQAPEMPEAGVSSATGNEKAAD